MKQKRDGFIKCNFVPERMDSAESSLMSEMYWGLFFLVVRSTHAEIFPSSLRAKPLKINLAGKQSDFACVGGPRRTKRGHEICGLHRQHSKHPGFDIYEHLGLSGWICVIIETTLEMISSPCAPASLEKCSPWGR